MKSLSLLLAWRYLRGTKQETTITTMVIVCFLGIAIGSCALALVAFVQQGFELATYKTLQGINADIIIRSHDESLDVPSIRSILHREFPEIIAISPHASDHLIIKADQDDANTIALLRGIDPAYDSKVSTLANTIIESEHGRKNLTTLLGDNNVLIGAALAHRANIQVGDTISLLIPQESSGRKRSMRFAPSNAVVSGLFKTGIDEFDNNIVISSLDFLEELFPNTIIAHIGVKLDKNVDEKAIIERIHQRLGLEVYSWKEMYPALLSALILEKYVMFMILALISLVASMSILSLLFMLTTQKRVDIAILKAMGVLDEQITRIFVFIGMSIALIGSLTGLGIALGLAYALEKYQLIPLPDAYFVTHLPAHIDPLTTLLVFVVVMALSFVATWLPARKTRSINISHVLRFEG